MGKKRLIYMSSPYTGAVVEGQVYELLEYMNRTDWFEDVLLLQSYAGDDDRQKAANILKKFSFRYKFFWQNPYYPHLYHKSIKALKDVLVDEVCENTVFHVRGDIRAIYVREALDEKFKKLMILDEFRGSFSEGGYISGRGLIEKIKTKVKYHHGKWCYKRIGEDDRMFYTAVSPTLCESLEKDFGFSHERMSMHPNIAAGFFKFDPVKREMVRKELGIRDDQILIVASSGESGLWQRDLDIIDAFIAKGYVVLNLSKNKIEKKNVISCFVPHNEMPAYLSAGDAAVLWREDIPLNNAACPSKFSEFAVMGLYIVHNKSVDIATNFIKDKDCGQLIDNPNDVSLSIDLFSEDDRKRRCEAGYAMFSIEKIARSYYNILCS